MPCSRGGLKQIMTILTLKLASFGIHIYINCEILYDIAFQKIQKNIYFENFDFFFEKLTLTVVLQYKY
jgi:hypothetical protein